MALMIESGYPVLIVDLGSGPEKIIHNKLVSDNVWRQIIIYRFGLCFPVCIVPYTNAF